MSQVVDDKPVVYIYGLIDPETDELRYIGKSIRPKERLQNHMNEVSFCHRSHWLQSLKRKGMAPKLEILEAVPTGKPWQQVEIDWIAWARGMGCNLVNNTTGGDGVCGLPEETRKRMAATWLGRKHKPETIELYRRMRVGKRHTEKFKKMMSSIMKGRQITWADKICKATRKIDESEIDVIKARIASGEGVQALAKEYGVHRTTMSKIKMGTYSLRHQGVKKKAK